MRPVPATLPLWRVLLGKWFVPFAVGFVIAYPLIVLAIYTPQYAATAEERAQRTSAPRAAARFAFHSGPIRSCMLIAALSTTFGRWGIDKEVQVVAYDQGAGAYAPRLWWLLRWLGHEQVAVLDGGFAAWERAGLPLETAATVRAPRRFTAAPAAGLVVTTAALAQAVAAGALTRGELTLVDARSADRFAGQNETLDPVAGHIPGARNHPFSGNQDAHGRFLSAPELRRCWADTLRERPAQTLIAMCGSGVTACHNLLALEAAGLAGARLYAGSWSEWIRDPARPVARGAETS